MTTVYIHIGYPKCFSTTLQRSYFEKHPNIHFGGIGIGDNISYATSQVELCFESLLKYSNNGFWEKNKLVAREHLKQFIGKGSRKKTVFSSEHLSMNFTLQGLENMVKYQRLSYLFDGFEVKLLAIKRDPLKLIRSLYGEFVRMGYCEDYEVFLKWLLVFKDRNFLPDLNYKLKNKQLTKVFGVDNIQWLEFEDIIEDGVEETLNKKLSGWLKLDEHFIPIGNNNPSLSNQELAALLQVNKEQPRGLGLAQTEPFERHRARVQYKNAGLFFNENEVFSNVLAKREALKKTKSYVGERGIDFDTAFKMEEQIVEVIENFTP